MKLTKTKELVLEENKMTYPHVITDEDGDICGIVYAVDCSEAVAMFRFLTNCQEFLKAEKIGLVFDCWGNKIENQARIVK